MKPIKVGLLGIGTVGSGTISVLARNQNEITRRAGRPIQIVAATARDLTKIRAVPLEGISIVATADSIIDNPEIDIVVELIGGISPAKDLVMRAINNGKQVVTANKALVALHGNEVFKAAQERGVVVAFEAAVAGGVPVIKMLREGLAGNQICWLAGIINGTTNFILTEMRDKARDFADVLAEAQKLGYAEADPTFDIEGIDAAHKLTILAAIAFGIPLQFDKVYTEGISKITQEDMLYAREFGYRIKHLGIARRVGNTVELRVHPTLVPQRKLIASVDGVMNAVLVNGDAVGSTLFYGAGAGSEATASAVVADLIDVVRGITSDPENRVPHLAFQPNALADIPIATMDEVVTAYYLRMQALDRPGVLADITRIFADLQISIEALLQKEAEEGSDHVPIIILTHPVQEQAMNQAIQKIEALPALQGSITRIRLETL